MAVNANWLAIMTAVALLGASAAAGQAQGERVTAPAATVSPKPARPAAAPAASTAPAGPALFNPRPPELLGALSVEDYSQRIRTTALDGMADLYGVCATRQVKPLAFASYEETVDPTDSLLPNIRANGDRAWRERVEVRGCGKSWIQNVLAVRPKGTGDLQVLQLLPGETRVSPAVFRNLYSPLMVAVAASGERCNGAKGERFTVLSTKIVEGPTDGASWDKAWKERWVVRYCDVQVELEPRFAPAGQVGGYTLSVSPGLVVTGN